MIAILKGGFDPPRTKRHWDQVRADVAKHEYSSRIQATKEGRYSLDVDPVGGWLTGAKTLIGPENAWFSPLLLADFPTLSLSNFPEGFNFGNGATGPASVGIRTQQPDGTTLTTVLSIAWVVFPYGTVLTAAKLYRLQEIVEGSPPGNPARHSWLTVMIDDPVNLAEFPPAPPARPTSEQIEFDAADLTKKMLMRDRKLELVR